jgi:maleate cis-trans isomerase
MAGVIKGTEYESLLKNQIADLTKIATVSTAYAVTAAMKVLEVKKVAVATAYRQEVNNKERGFLEAYGIKVTKIKGLGYVTPVESYPLAAKPTS